MTEHHGELLHTNPRIKHQTRRRRHFKSFIEFDTEFKFPVSGVQVFRAPPWKESEDSNGLVLAYPVTIISNFKTIGPVL